MLGDLNERYVSPRRYLIDALRALPFVLGSRVRRTCNPLFLPLVFAFVWWAVFLGTQQRSGLVALIPTLITVMALMLRDAYRSVTLNWFRATAVDMGIAAAGVLLSQAILVVTAPSLVLSKEALLGSFPVGFIILFFVRLQSPTGFHRPPTFARSLSMQELRSEIDVYESVVRRAIRIEIGACMVVAVGFLPPLLTPVPLHIKVGSGLTSAAGMFVGWFLYRYARVRPIPVDLGFAATVAAYRADLEHRWRLSMSYLWWYIVPLSVGMLVATIGSQLQRSSSFLAIALIVLVFVSVGTVLVFVQRGVAHKTKQRMDQLAIVSEIQPNRD